MKMSDLDLLINRKPPEPLLVPRWGTVTQASPLRVRLDGEATALTITPATLVAGLALNNRVWCVLAGKQLIVVGKLN